MHASVYSVVPARCSSPCSRSRSLFCLSFARARAVSPPLPLSIRDFRLCVLILGVHLTPPKSLAPRALFLSLSRAHNLPYTTITFHALALTSRSSGRPGHMTTQSFLFFTPWGHVHTHANTHANTHARTPTHTPAHACTHAHTHTHSRTRTHTRIRTCYAYTQMYKCIPFEYIIISSHEHT